MRFLCWLLAVLVLTFCCRGIHANIFDRSKVNFPAFPPSPPANITVGAYYYPWWYRHFQISREGYVRKVLQPRHEIRLGEYDDRAVSVVEQHIEWSRQGNIKVWVSSWWGPNSGEDLFLKNLIFTPTPVVSNLNNHKVAILYETTGRIKQSENYDLRRVPGDFDYICQQMKYLNHSNYYKINGRPVLVVYLTRLLDGRELLDDVVPIIRSKCPGVYIIGDQVWGNPPGKTLNYLDAVTNYDWYGNVGRPQYAGQARVNDYYKKSKAWKDYAAFHNTFFVPAVSPGFNDRGIRLATNHTAMSRRLDPTMAEGTLFAAQLINATKLVDPGADYLMLVNSFNEWHEDTQVEPCDGITTTEPAPYTQGVEHVGYGTLYLDILATYTLTNQLLAPTSVRPIKFTGLPIASNIQLAAYYWSWFTEDNFAKGLRGKLDPPQSSTFSLAPDPIPEDLAISWQGNIRTWITPWQQPGDISDTGAAALFNHTFLVNSGHKIALHYYVHLRVQTSYTPGMNSAVYKDILYLCEKYFNSATYFKTSTGKPVLFIGLTRTFDKTRLTNIVNDIRGASQSRGMALHLVGDQVWRGTQPAPYFPFALLDAVMNFDVYGNLGRPAGNAGTAKLDEYYEQQRQWRIAAWREKASFIPSVLPGFNDRAVRNTNNAMSRVLEKGGAEGSWFEGSLDRAKHLVDPILNNLMIVQSLNHFAEDTQIYPICGGNTDKPMTLTQNLTYVAYENLYLNMLTARFGSFANPNSPGVYKCPLPLMCRMGSVWKSSAPDIATCSSIESKRQQNLNITNDCNLKGTGGDTGNQACSRSCTQECRSATVVSIVTTPLSCKMDADWRDPLGRTCSFIQLQLQGNQDVTTFCNQVGTSGKIGTEACSKVCALECRGVP